LQSQLIALRVKRVSVVHAVVAMMLVLAVLSGAAPFNALSSRHFCTMACCAGLPPHVAGSCHAHLSNRRRAEREPTCGGVNNSALSHAHSMQMPSATAAEMVMPDHCSAGDHSLAQTPSSQGDAERQATIAPLTLEQPCPPDCGVGVTSSMQMRRPRDNAAVAHADSPRPPTPATLSHDNIDCFLTLTAFNRPFNPRGPPLLT
jgi:hypothetical protein